MQIEQEFDKRIKRSARTTIVFLLLSILLAFALVILGIYSTRNESLTFVNIFWACVLLTILFYGIGIIRIANLQDDIDEFERQNLDRVEPT
jgi:lipopolysaccharide export LptBFGC system permease protein LptF